MLISLGAQQSISEWYKLFATVNSEKEKIEYVEALREETKILEH